MITNPFKDINLKKIILDAWHNQLPKISGTLLISFSMALCAIAVVYIISLIKQIPPAWLTRDPNDITGSHFYIGLLSNLGIMGWTSAAAICFFCASLLKKEVKFRESFLFLIFSGSICLLLDLDDAFMLHERVWPYLHVPEKVIFMGYIIIMAGYLIYFLHTILKTDYIILILAFGFLGVSAVIDQIIPFSEFIAFMEDGPKFTGIILLLAYYSRTSFKMVKEIR